MRNSIPDKIDLCIKEDYYLSKLKYNQRTFDHIQWKFLPSSRCIVQIIIYSLIPLLTWFSYYFMVKFFIDFSMYNRMMHYVEINIYVVC